MDLGIPLLTPSQIEELNAMVTGILQENKKKLQDQLAEQGPLEHASILQLYGLVVSEWNKKTNIIDNLCHFSLTMMSTVTLLWDQKAELEERLQTAEHMVDSLQHHLQDMGEENDLYKQKINEAETHIESINGEKEKIEELYRSQSCFVFQQHQQEENSLAGCPSLHLLPQQNHRQIIEEREKEKEKEKKIKDCASCSYHESQLQVEKEKTEESSRLLSLQQQELQELRAAKQQLLSQLQQLTQETQLAKMEVELAEIAVKDALSYRESSISSRSMISYRQNDEIHATRSQAQYISGELECFSNLDDSFQNRNSLINEMSSQGIVHFSSTPSHTHDQPEKPDADQTAPSPFKKKLSLVNDTPTLNDTPSFSDVCQESTLQVLEQQSSKNKFSDLKIFKNRKTVSLQCDLIKNLPKLKFLEKVEKKPEPEKKSEVRERPQTERELEKKDKAAGVKEKNDKTAALAKSMRLEKEKKTMRKSGRQMGRSMQSEIVPEGPSSLGRLFSFLSSKLVTERIRVK